VHTNKEDSNLLVVVHYILSEMDITTSFFLH
jgi:hypothetical protein